MHSIRQDCGQDAQGSNAGARRMFRVAVIMKLLERQKRPYRRVAMAG
jgi:hypothetical protein